jgi:hypothetical protein
LGLAVREQGGLVERELTAPAKVIVAAMATEEWERLSERLVPALGGGRPLGECGVRRLSGSVKE